MGLLLNGITGTYSVPSIPKSYKYSHFDATMTFSLTSDAGTVQKRVDIKNLLEQAWKSVTKKADSRPCNEYFKTLFKKKTLKEILDEGDITLHLLEPKPGKGWDVVPEANAAGRDIGLNPELLVDNDADAMACTLVHELAHVAGATTDASAKNALDAETALNSCKCNKRFRKEATGSIQDIRLERFGGSRYA